eukprot:18165-Pelagomonas_calceolata.AAC.5
MQQTCAPLSTIVLLMNAWEEREEPGLSKGELSNTMMRHNSLKNKVYTGQAGERCLSLLHGPQLFHAQGDLPGLPAAPGVWLHGCSMHVTGSVKPLPES